MAMRADVFSDLKNKFYGWLNTMGVDPDGAGKHYRDYLEAIGEPLRPHEAPAGMWFGMYEALTRDRPKPIYSVNGVADFARNYGKAVPFFTVGRAPEAARERMRALYPNAADFDALYDFAYSASVGDKGHTRNGFVRYLQFLYVLEAQVDGATSAAEFPIDGPRQQIVYGAPGTGKSFMTDGKLTDAEGNPKAVVYRTTFHPDSDYAFFVGAYKPTMEDGKIIYAFRPQTFMDAYVKAWRILANEDVSNLPVVLVIEEINRGNCAQIFGDLFQLLDRDEATGYSTYPIVADIDLSRWLKGTGRFGAGLTGVARPDCIKQWDWDLIVKGELLALPPNLYIWATMNTSDQSLFPIDSAFKRRWEWKYVPISKPSEEGFADRTIVANGYKYDWWDFITILNSHIADITKSEDKQLGYFFAKAADETGYITAERFANKVLFYLYNDVFKDWNLPAAIFAKGTNGEKFAFKDFFYTEKTVVGAKTFLPGDVKEEVVAEFIEKQQDNGHKKVGKTPSNASSTLPSSDPVPASGE